MFCRVPAPKRFARGFTFVELMIALVVLGVIVALALPSFLGAIRKSRRAEAFTALSQVQLAQERFRANNAAFAASLTNSPTAVDPTARGLGLPTTGTPSGRYALSVGNTGADGYTATAAASSGSSQAADGNCAQLRVRVDRGNVFYGSAPLAGTFAESAAGNACWSR